MNLSEKEKRKMLAAAEIVENGDLAVLKKLIEFMDFLEKYEIEEGKMSSILQKVEEMKTMCETMMSEMKGETKSEMKEMGYSLNELQLALENKINSSEKTSLSQIKELSKRISDEIRNIRDSIPSMPDLTSIEEKLVEVENKIPVLKDKIIPTTEIRDKLESLEGDERLDKKAIKGIDAIEKEINDLKSKKGNTVYVGGGNSGGGKTVKAYDLSSQLNGVLKTFSLPAFWRIISVHSSSFPNAFRPTVDYTVDGAAFTVTFTSEITASTTLASGQTLLVIYAD